jgi:hypothetical protein
MNRREDPSTNSSRAAGVSAQDQWIASVRAEAIPRIEADCRFVGADALRNNFEKAVLEWKRYRRMRTAINFGNEICLALELLTRRSDIARLAYEPKLLGTKKSMDFYLECDDGARVWIDAKTVAPKNGDNQALKARLGFLTKSSEVEQKVAALTVAEHAPVYLAFFSGAGAWHRDDLEDFADFYRTGRFRGDDWAAPEIAGQVKARKIKISGTITGFCFLERQHHDIRASQFDWDVRGPRVFGSQ